MRLGIPEEMRNELERCGGLDALLREQPSKKTLNAVAKRFALLAKPVRLRILLLLDHDELCVCVIKRAVSCPDSKLSYHLSCLKRAGLIKSRRDRSYLMYSLTGKGRAVLKEVRRTLGV